jgi:hypothetical protein
MKRFLLALILVSSLSFGQTADQVREQVRTETEKRITNLNKKFDELLAITPSEKELRAACAVNCASPPVQDGLRNAAVKRMATLDAVVSQIHREVDAYIARTVDGKHLDLDRKSVEQGLKQILVQEYDEPAFAFVLNSARGRSLIVAYALHKGLMMGERATSVTLRAYKTTDIGVELADFTGDDMAGYGNVSVKELHSPVPDETWLLVLGYMTGANGPNVRMRVYAYNGTKFRTMWMPENVWGAFTIRVTDHGFTVDGSYYREGQERHDRYFLAPDGLYLSPSGK